MKTSLSAVFHGEPGKLTLEEIPVPNPGPGEVLVRIQGCTLCGSDLHSFEGRRQVPVPTILGHEITGEIAAFGPGVPRLDSVGQPLAEGTRITWAIVASCGNCFYCQRDWPQKCLNAVKYGHEVLHPGRELRGGLAEYCLLAPGSTLIRLPDDLPLSVACPANCATATVAAAVEAAGELQGRAVTIHGAGLLGLTAAAMCRQRGAAEVIVTDIRADRLQLAPQFGATRTASPEELDATARDATGGFGVDAAIELSGSSAGFTDAWKTIRTGGTLVAIGAVFPGPPVPLAVEQLVRRCVTLKGVHNYGPRHLKMAVDFLTQSNGTLPLASPVQRWIPLHDVSRAFEEARDPAAIRIGVTCQSSSPR